MDADVDVVSHALAGANWIRMAMHGEVEADEHEDTERYRDGCVCPYEWTWTLPVILEKRLASCFKCYTHSWPHHHLHLTPVSLRGPMR